MRERNRLRPPEATLVVVSLLALPFVLASARPAFAGPVRLDLAGEISTTNVPTLFPGDSIVVSIFVDTQTADEDPTPGLYLASTPGTFQSVINALPPSEGDVLSISADSGTGAWSASLYQTSLGAVGPVNVSLSGTGATPDRILPDFSAFSAGTVEFEPSMPFLYSIDADVFSVQVVATPPVPAMPGVALVLLGSLLLASGPLPARRVLPRFRLGSRS